MGAVLVLALAGGVPWWIRVVTAAVLVGIAYYVQPYRRRTRRGRAFEVPRSAAPQLYRLLEEVASAVKAPMVDTVHLTWQYNAAYGRDGFRRRAIWIGLPLWAALGPQERVALLAHEFGHAVNGDLRNNVPVRRALITLEGWRSLLDPTPGRRQPWGAPGAIGLVALAERIVLPLVLLPLTVVIGAVARSLELLANRVGQRCEYYADELSARAGGTAGAVGFVDQLVMADVAARAVTQAARFSREIDPWAFASQRLRDIPDTERERRRRLARVKLSRIDTTHPPTQFRVDLLEARPVRQPAVVLHRVGSEELDHELAPASVRVSQALRGSLGAER